MKVLLTPMGSAGDTYPFVALGLELKRRGHEVTIITGEPFASLVTSLGLEYVQLLTKQEYRDAIDDPELWHPRRGFRKVASLIAEPIRRTFRLVQERYEPGKTIVVSHSLDVASRVLQDKTGMPAVTVHLAPILFRTNHLTPVPTGTLEISRWPTWAKRALWWAVDRWMIDPPICPVVNELRAEVGLKPVHRIFGDWLHSPLLTIGLFPDWFAPPQPDWPAQAKLTSFPLWDAPTTAIASEEVRHYLDVGEPPIVFTPGSANIHAHNFFSAAIEACQILNRRGLLLTRHAEHLPASLPPLIHRFDYAPLREILPRCAALVHHGGIGTTAAALAGGVPQLIMPMSHDQPDNAARVDRLGVARRLLPRRFTGPNVASVLKELLDSPDVKRRCAQLSRKCLEDRGIERACDLIEDVRPCAAASRPRRGVRDWPTA
jgi:UDP:flavonoid glycosyltransferase YjiC (YdhE family)